MVQTFHATLQKSEFLTADVATFTFELPSSVHLDFLPGQYLIMHVPKDDQEDARRMFSLLTPPGEPTFTFLAKIIPGGVASEYFKSLKSGQQVLFQGPAGAFTYKENDNDKVFVATGTGIAPVMSILRNYLPQTKARIKLLWGLKTSEDVYMLDELKKWKEQYSNFDFLICLSRQKQVEEHAHPHLFSFGYVTGPLEEYIRTKTPESVADYYICGDRNIVESIRQSALDEGIVKESVSFEKFV